VLPVLPLPCLARAKKKTKKKLLGGYSLEYLLGRCLTYFQRYHRAFATLEDYRYPYLYRVDD
jgi:hypothetical protein